MFEVKIVMTLHTIFSQYFKISSSKNTSAILRFYCLGSFLFITRFAFDYLVYLYRDDLKGIAYNTMLVVEYFIWCFTAQINGQAYLSTYTRAILTCDSHMDYAKKVFEINYVFVLMLISVFLSMLSLFSDSFLSQYWAGILSEERYGFLLLFSQWFMFQSLELATFRVYIVVGLLHNRLMMLRKTFDNITIPVDTVRKYEVRMKMREVRRCFINYTNLLDAFDTVSGHVHFIMFVVLLFAVPELVMFGYSILKQIIFKQFCLRIIIVDGIRCILRIIAPCIICELCHNEVDHLKMLLTNQIIKCSDAELRAELQLALDYVTRRPFTFTLLHAVRVDLQLPVAIFAFVVTYVILLIEFTHFVL